MSCKIIKVFLLVIFSFFVIQTIPALAQVNEVYGLDGPPVAGMETADDLDIKQVISNIISWVLGFLGLIAVSVVMYAGFLWMTSGGVADKISRAKKMLINGLIGLLIIIFSWVIVTLVFKTVSDAIFGGDFTDKIPSQYFSPGFGALGVCTLSYVYPEPWQKEVPRNTTIMVTFKEKLNPLSVCIADDGSPCDCNQAGCSLINYNNLTIYPKNLGNSEENYLKNAIAQLTEDQKTIIIIPQEYLGSSSGNISYVVRLSGLEKENNDLIFSTCASDWFEWEFEVSDKIDLIPPQILSGGIFPLPDDEKDNKIETVAVKAQGSISVQACPGIYQAATNENPVPIGSSGPATATVYSDYSKPYNTLELVVLSNNSVQLKSGVNLLGTANWVNNSVTFPEYITLNVDNWEAGNSWTVQVNQRQLADTLTIGNQVYTFAEEASNISQITVPSPCNLGGQAQNIANQLNNHPNIAPTLSGTTVNLEARLAGVASNSIILATTNETALLLAPMSGGLNGGTSYIINDSADGPMNSIIQINFNEAINPFNVSGPATLVQDYIRVINNQAGALAAGQACGQNSNCLSYNCQSGQCIGNILAGEFRISNRYRTVEFISDNECGTNSCGEKFYCLPADSNLRVELRAADLRSCASDNDCLMYQPFGQCLNSDLGYQTCQNTDGRYFPTSDVNNLNGVVDAAFNSLDGNRNSFADGPASYYNENNPNPDSGDNYRWSFFINDVINTNPPNINFVSPLQGSPEVSSIDPIKIYFDSLMLNSSLRSGSIILTGPSGTTEHKLINLSTDAGAVGYWIGSENVDLNLDGKADVTYATILNTGLPPLVTWRAQVGSGVRNIYQNCFKPSSGPDCSASEENPSCCFGAPTSILDAQGNCLP